MGIEVAWVKRGIVIHHISNKYTLYFRPIRRGLRGRETNVIHIIVAPKSVLLDKSNVNLRGLGTNVIPITIVPKSVLLGRNNVDWRGIKMNVM